ncbi:amidohydrolase family protein [Legionella gresilensis]|uniref:amidohydrolase family protein n=1 Tax=Legionella gresilensis TaxID=91823 RepID=UPI0010410355|nr:amidohydrolase family protein [Legionella gresilensis]
MKIIDAHVHFYDTQVNQHDFLNSPDPTFTEIVGDYSKLPKSYLPQNYFQDTSSYNIEGVVWHEYLSTDPLKEAQWANSLVNTEKFKQAMVVLVDFLDLNLESKLDFYQSLPYVVAVREHLGWDNNNSLRRFSKRSDLLTDPKWNNNLNLLRNYSFKCGLEVFAHQLSDLNKVITHYPNLEFTIAVMGWPLNIAPVGFQQWKKELISIAKNANVCFEISAIECIFGMNWKVEQIKPWILTAIEIFGINRCMFGSHMPIAKLSRSFEQLYTAYEDILVNFTIHEKNEIFYNVAAKWFKF